MILAVIPARGGSKRIPDKNIRPFAGRPMISYSILAARQSGVFDRIIVSTDSGEIAEVARAHGAETPFLRPEELSGDHTPTAPVVAHALKWVAEEQGKEPEFVCCIYATAPFLRPVFLRQGFDILKDTGAPAAFSVTTFPFPIFRALHITKEGSLAMVWPEYELTRSNDLMETYHDAGQFYWLKTGSFLQTGRMYAQGARPVIIPRKWVQDIDTPEDWEVAERNFAGLGLPKREG